MTPEQRKWAESKRNIRTDAEAGKRQERKVHDFKEDAIGMGVYFIVRVSSGRGQWRGGEYEYMEVYREYPPSLLGPHRLARRGNPRELNFF